MATEKASGKVGYKIIRIDVNNDKNKWLLKVAKLAPFRLSNFCTHSVRFPTYFFLSKKKYAKRATATYSS